MALVNFVYKFCKHLQVTVKDQVAEEEENKEDQESVEAETEVGKIQTIFLFFFSVKMKVEGPSPLMSSSFQLWSVYSWWKNTAKRLQASV